MLKRISKVTQLHQQTRNMSIHAYPIHISYARIPCQRSSVVIALHGSSFNSDGFHSGCLI